MKYFPPKYYFKRDSGNIHGWKLSATPDGVLVQHFHTFVPATSKIHRVWGRSPLSDYTRLDESLEIPGGEEVTPDVFQEYFNG